MALPAAAAAAVALFLAGVCGAVQYKVGDLDSWGVPPPFKSDLYANWSQSHHFQLGDSLLFLYPPSQDSVIRVTGRAFNACVTAPLLSIDDGNSVYNLTRPGRFYFTSGKDGHCEKGQKLAVDVPLANGTFLPPGADEDQPPAAAPGASPGGGVAGAPMYPVVFGPSAAQSSGAAQWQQLAHRSAVAVAAVTAVVGVLLGSYC